MTKDCASRYNDGKSELSYNLLGKESNEGKGKVWSYGGVKYARGNWLKGASYVQTADSLLRHLVAFLNGEDVDPESGLPHVDHMQCNAQILSQSFHTRKDLDDRELKAEPVKDFTDYKVGTRPLSHLEDYISPEVKAAADRLVKDRLAVDETSNPFNGAIDECYNQGMAALEEDDSCPHAELLADYGSRHKDFTSS